MQQIGKFVTVVSLCTALAVPAMGAGGSGHRGDKVQLGPRPFYLVDQMEEGWLKTKLERCAKRPAKRSDFSIGTWTLERSGRIVEDVLADDGDPFYYASTLDALNNDGDILKTLDVLARDVGILGIFSDWPATVTYYANCFGLD